MRVQGFWAIPLVACWSSLVVAAFDPTDVVQVQGSIGWAYDDNLYRLPDIDQNFGILPQNRSDTLLTKGVGLKIDKPVSRQHLLLDLNLYETRFSNNKNLDHNGGSGKAEWQWRIGNYWSGEATYSKRRRLAGFADLRRTVQDLIETDSYTLSGGYDFHPRWRIGGEMNNQESSHSESVRRTLNFDTHSIGLNLSYRTPADSSLSIHGRRTERNYPNRPATSLITDNRRTEDRLSLSTAWRPSEIVRLNGQLGYTTIQHERLSSRDFSGVVWRIDADWDATSKLRLNLNGSRDVRPDEEVSASYLVIDSVGIEPTYALSSKITLRAEYTYQHRDYRGDPGLLLFPLLREDTNRTARMGLSYLPLRNLVLSLSYESGQRRSNIQQNSFEYTAWYGTVLVRF